MATVSRRRRWTALFVLTVLVAGGCNPFTMPFFMLYGLDQGVPPEHKIAREKHEVRVLILTSSGTEWRPELLGADRELTGLVAHHLQEQCQQNKEHVTVIPNSKLQRYKEDHPGWKAMPPEEIGKYFDADYVIDLEIGGLSLYEKDSCNQFFRGHAEISVTLLDLSKHNDETPYRKEYECEYPKTRGPVPIDETNPQKFRQEFLRRVACEIAWLFTSHPMEDHFACD